MKDADQIEVTRESYICSECGRVCTGTPAEAMKMGEKIMSLWDEKGEGQMRDVLAKHGLGFVPDEEMYFMCPECQAEDEN